MSFSCPQAPDDTSEHPSPIAPRCPSQRRPVTPRPPHSLPSLVVADRQAAKAMMMESEDVRSPCAHAMVWRGHRLRDGGSWGCPGTFLRASARSYSTRRLMHRHFAHIALIHTGERLGGEGAACLSLLASQWGGWALQRAPLPAPHAHAVPSRSIPNAGSVRRPSSFPPSLVMLCLLLSSPCAAPAPRPSFLLLSCCCQSRTASLCRGPAPQLLPVLAQPAGWWLQPPLPGRGDREEKL